MAVLGFLLVVNSSCQEAQANRWCGAATPESWRRRASGTGSSEHPHLGLGTEHLLLIGSQDQGLLEGHIVRLGADVALAIEEQHTQQLAGGNRFAEAFGYEEMHRDDAHRAGRVA